MFGYPPIYNTSNLKYHRAFILYMYMHSIYTCTCTHVHVCDGSYPYTVRKLQWNGQLTITDKGYGPNTGTIVIFTLYDGASNNIRECPNIPV